MATSEDSTFKQWPEELLKIYGQLPLPSLYEFVLSNERMAAQLRQQSRDLHAMSCTLSALKQQVQTLDEHLQTELAELPELEETHPETSLLKEEIIDTKEEKERFYPAWEVDMMRQSNTLEQRQWEEIYIAMLEVILQMLQENQGTYRKILELLKESSLESAIQHAVAQIIEQHTQKLLSIHDQILAHLKDIDLDPITPQPGELYNEDLHRVIDKTPLTRAAKSRRNTILRVIRIGYRRHGELVRQADVCVWG